jgi:predicted ribosome quality control (RQC) complex YloA/Tae2 family protein
MGADKFENEDLIRYGLPEDLWFHVDNLSSAHVYLRMRKNQKIEDLSRKAIQECAQLVKANSIEGCKLKTVDVGKC